MNDIMEKQIAGFFISELGVDCGEVVVETSLFSSYLYSENNARKFSNYISHVYGVEITELEISDENFGPTEI